MPKNKFIKNVVILGISGILSKLFDFSFRAYYSQILGSEGMGLLSLGLSLHGLMLTISTAGLGVAVSKITSEYLEINSLSSVKTAVRTGVFSVLILSLLVTLTVLLFPEFLADKILGDKRVAKSLCALCPSVIFMGISYCLKGFFYANRKALPPASSEFLEQAVKFVSIRFFLKTLLPYGIEYACVGIFAGITLGELSSCAYLTIFYLREEKGYLTKANMPAPDRKSVFLRMLGISVPSLITSLCVSGFRMQEEVLIVSALRRGGMSHSDALSSLGIVHGMAMPLLVLPLTLSGSVMSLLIPEISRVGMGTRLKETALKVYRYGIYIGLFVCGVFLLFGKELCNAFYNSYDAAYVVLCLCPLLPVMFLDSLSCSILNGLGKQFKILLFTLLDFGLRFSLIYFTLPKGQMNAFIVMVILSNIFTCSLTLSAVIKSCRQR